MNRATPNGRSLYRLGDSDDLERHVTVLRSCTEQWGPCHPQTLAAVQQLAVAFWLAGYTDQAVALLEEALDLLAATTGRESALRIDLLGSLTEILFEQRRLEQAQILQREVLEYRVQHSGPNDASSLEAKGDLAAVLYELGQEREASRLEQEAFEGARTHLGKTHPVTSVLAWNRAVNGERRGDVESAQRIIRSELAWLLAEEPSHLEGDQRAIRDLLERRLNWAGATRC
jgi:tetratricopeptide (TPR) repeat protein